MSAKRRLDHILIELGYISEEQLVESLNRQRAHGGRVGTALMFLRFITEAQLVEALSIQFNVPGVVLGDVNIAGEFATLIPERMMRSRLAVPFACRSSGNVLSFAVVDPLQPGLRDELEFILRGKRVELHVATEVSIQTAIASLLDGADDTVENKLSLEFPRGLLEAADEEDTQISQKAAAVTSTAGRILIVTDEEFSIRNVKSVIERDGAVVSTISSLIDLSDALSSDEFTAVYIQDQLIEDRSFLQCLIRSYNMHTRVFWFNSCSDWLVGGPREFSSVDIGSEYATLVNILLADRSGTLEKDRSITQYVSATCDRLGLWGIEKHTLLLSTQMYIVAHSLGLVQPSLNDGQARLKTIADFFRAAYSNDTVVAPLTCAYRRLELSQLSGAVNSDLFGGNIITALDIVYQWIGDRDQIRIDEFDDIRNMLNDQTGTLLLPCVIEAMLHAIQEQHLENELNSSAIEIVVYRSPNTEAPVLRELSLLERGIRLVHAFTLDDLQATIARRQPDLVILAFPADEASLQSTLNSISADDLNMSEIPTLALTDCDSRAALKSMYTAGVIDTMPMDSSANALSAKIKSVVERLQIANESATARKGEARGDLENMNLIDLIQAMGPGRKTAEIILEHDDDMLKLFMLEGQIVYAEGCGGEGQEPIFQGLQWQRGSFLVRRIDAADIPKPNIHVSNEHILMEGCRLMDEA